MTWPTPSTAQLRTMARLLWIGCVANAVLGIGLASWATWAPWGLAHLVVLVAVVTLASLVEGGYQLQDAYLETATDQAAKTKAERRMAEIATAEFARAAARGEIAIDVDGGGSRH